MKPQKKILIADDHAAIRSGIKHVLTHEFSSVEFDEAVRFEEIFEKLRQSEWDLLILDIDLPGRNGLEILKQINRENLAIPVLVFSFHREDQLAIQVLKAGARGYLSKHAASTELVNAVMQILSGGKYISSFVVKELESQTTVSNIPFS